MDDSLAIYLHDHLAGAALAVDLLEAMRDKHRDDSLGTFAATLLKEVEADRSVLSNLANRIGSGSSKLKELGAWFAEKISRLKLDSGPCGLGTFEALEFLALGVLGKAALWDALAVAAPLNKRLQGTDFLHLSARAREQHAMIEECRLETAKSTFFETAE
jgi:hypothetical protein